MATAAVSDASLAAAYVELLDENVLLWKEIQRMQSEAPCPHCGSPGRVQPRPPEDFPIRRDDA